MGFIADGAVERGDTAPAIRCLNKSFLEMTTAIPRKGIVVQAATQLSWNQRHPWDVQKG